MTPLHPHHGHAGFVYLIYGLIVLIGGIVGYSKAKSTPSLIASIVSFVIALLAAIIFRHHPRASLALGGLLSIALTIFFAVRYSATKKAMPAIPVGVISLLVFLYTIWQFIKLSHLHSS